MILLPAIDIRDGKAVRLEQGRFDRETVYGADPLEAARDWVEQGAEQLHVVDLDGAREGEPVNLEQLEQIASELGVPVQFGGGLRSADAIEGALAAGAGRVILGTAAYRDPGLLAEALARHGDRVAVAVDVRDGAVSVAGWVEGTGLTPEAAIAAMQERGASTFVFTDADRDGMLSGPDLDLVGRVADAVDGSFVYSGGIGALEHLSALRSLGLENLSGVISGKALYERRFGVAEAIEALGGAG